MYWSCCLDAFDSLAKKDDSEQQYTGRCVNARSNEIIKRFAHAVQREIVSRASECFFYGLTA